MHFTLDFELGIALEDQGKIFEKFSQLSRGHTREHAGTGLGLTITKWIAHQLGGDVTLVSAPGKGSTFTLQLDGS